MRGHEQGAPAEVSHDKCGRRLMRSRIKRGERLVENDARTGMRKRSHQLYSPTLPTGKPRNRPAQRILGEKLRQKRMRLAPRKRPRRAEQYVLLGSHSLYQPGILELHGEPAPAGQRVVGLDCVVLRGLLGALAVHGLITNRLAAHLALHGPS